MSGLCTERKLATSGSFPVGVLQASRTRGEQMIFEVSQEFIEESGVWLDAVDLKFGFERGFLRAGDVVAVATSQTLAGATDPALVKLGELFRQDSDQIEEVLSSVRYTETPPRSDIWLYLQMRAAYLVRSTLRDPLGVVEEIYADFDYPNSIASIVRYMPDDSPERGEHVLMERWAAYVGTDKHGS